MMSWVVVILFHVVAQDWCHEMLPLRRQVYRHAHVLVNDARMIDRNTSSGEFKGFSDWCPGWLLCCHSRLVPRSVALAQSV